MKRSWRITEQNKARFLAHLERSDFSKPKKVTIEPWVRHRSTNQNAYYHGVVLKEIALETGHDADELHEFFKRRFLPCRTIEVAGQVIDAPPSTTDLSTIEFRDYIDRIAAFAATELGIAISEPGQAA